MPGREGYASIKSGGKKLMWRWRDCSTGSELQTEALLEK
jgi:hypothetical protein